MNKRNKLLFLLIAITFILLCVGLNCCRHKNVINNIEDLNNPAHKVGVMRDSYGMFIGEKYFTQSNLKYFLKDDAGYKALRSGKIEMLLQDKLTSTFITNNNSKLAIYPKSYGKIEIAVAAKNGNTELINQVNEFIDEYTKNNVIKNTYTYWLSAGSKKQMPNFKKVDSSQPKLRVGTNGGIKPYSYRGKKNQLMGADIEIAKHLGEYLNREVEFTELSFEDLIHALNTDKIDLIISNFNITDERKQVLEFSKPYAITTIVPVIKKNKVIANEKFTSIDQLNGKEIGVLAGSIHDAIVTEKIENSIPVYYNANSDMIMALSQNKIKASISDEPVARDMIKNGLELEILKPYLKKSNYALAFSLNNKELRDEFSKVIEEFEKDGTLKDIDDTWFGKDESKKVLPEVLGENRRGVLKLGVDSTMVPFDYVKDNQIVGYEVDLVHRIGKKLGYQIEVQNYSFTALIPSLASSKINIAASCIDVTPEREKSVLFSSPTYHGGVVVVVNSQHTNPQISGLNSIKKSFRRTFLDEDRYKLIFQGLWVTIVISFFSIIFGSILGLLVCLFRRSKNKWFSTLARVYISIVQGTPILVLLMILFYIIFANVEIDAVLVAIIAFTIDFAAYAAEMFRSGIDAVDKGQIEASGAMGFNRVQTFIKITLPQSLKHVLPVYRGEVVSTIKITSIVGYIAIQDLTKVSDIIRSRTYEAFFPLISTAVIYFVLAYLIAHFIKIFEYKVNPVHRKRIVKGIKQND